MAELITNKARFPFDTGSGKYGLRMKTAVEGLVSMCDSLTIHAVNTDTSAVYSADLSWDGNTDWLIRIENNSLYHFVRYVVKNADGTYSEYAPNEYGQCSIYGVLTENAAVAEVTTCGTNLLIAALPCEGDYCGICFSVFKIVDQFTGAEKVVVCVGGSNSSQYYEMGKFYITEGGTTAECNLTKNVNGQTPNGIVSAAPAVAYTSSGAIPLSGFMGGKNEPLLYYLFNGTTAINYPARLSKFTLAGHTFISLGQKLCIRTS